MSGKRSRTKGHSFERQIAREFKELGFEEARRQLEYNENDCNGVDLQGTGEWRVQCKRLKKYAPITCIKEIKTSGIHLLITKADNEPTVAVMYWDDLKKILKDIGEAYAGEG